MSSPARPGLVGGAIVAAVGLAWLAILVALTRDPTAWILFSGVGGLIVLVALGIGANTGHNAALWQDQATAVPGQVCVATGAAIVALDLLLTLTLAPQGDAGASLQWSLPCPIILIVVGLDLWRQARKQLLKPLGRPSP